MMTLQAILDLPAAFWLWVIGVGLLGGVSFRLAWSVLEAYERRNWGSDEW